MKNTFGFIGCGNMGGALAEAVAKTVLGDNIMVCDSAYDKAERLGRKCGMQVSDLASIVKSCQYIFLAVKPQGAESLFASIRPLLQKRKDPFVLISMLAGTSISTLEALAGCSCAIIRIMPNTPVAVGEGMILYTANDSVSQADLECFISALSLAGKTDAIEETLIDAASVISGCGPAFMYMFLEAMVTAGEKLGLDGAQARTYAQQTMIGAATLAASSPETLEALRVKVCSPGGSTIEGVKKFQSLGLSDTVEQALGASYRRTLELGKK